MSFPDAVKHVLSNYATFTGRARRSEYWWFYLFFIVLYAVAYAIDLSLIGYPVLALIVALGLLVPNIAVAARRLHDTGRSGWWQLIALVPIVGGILLIVWLATDSKGDNDYGPSPKGELAGTV